MERGVRKYRDELLRVIDDVSVAETVSECPCEELRTKLIENRFNLVVVGQFKRGKTTFINALVGAELLPTAVVPLTSIVTVIEYGPSLHIRVFFNNGEVKEITREELPLYVTEKGNPRNRRDVAEVVVHYPSEYLKDGVRLIDTPGVGSVYQHNTDVAYEYLPRSDAAVFLISVDQPLSSAEVDFLKDVKQYSDRIFFLQNKADYLSEAEQRESVEFTMRVLRENAGYQSPEIYPVSAKLALEGKIEHNRELLEKSNLPVFEERLRRFLIEEKGSILIRSVSNNLLRVISEAILRAELELKSIQTPVEVLKEKLDAFEAKRQEIESEKGEFDILLEGETKRIIENILDPDLEQAKKELSEVLMPEFEDFYNEIRSRSTGELRRGLEEFIVNRLKEYYAVFRKNEDAKVSKSFEKVCEKFGRRINETIDFLLQYSSELFSVSFESFRAESLWTVESSLYYKFKDEPLMIEMLGDALTSVLPSFLGKPLVFRGMKRYLADMIDRQAGRIRWDFVDRLQKSRRDFRWEMLAKIKETVDGISNAVRRGSEQRQKGIEEVMQREKEITAELQRLYSLKSHVMAIREMTEEAAV